MDETERNFISHITPDNAYQMLKSVYSNDPDFDELFDRLPIPLSDRQIVAETVRLDRELGWTKLKGYDPLKSITYRLLTDKEFAQQQEERLRAILETLKDKASEDVPKEEEGKAVGGGSFSVSNICREHETD